MTSVKRTNQVDPDPYTIASTFFSAAALVLQFVQVWQASVSAQPLNSANKGQILDELDSQTRKSLEVGDQLLRSIERGSDNSELEFYQKPYCVGNILLIDGDHYNQFFSRLAEMYACLANTSRWINHTIGYDPITAANLGRRLAISLPEMRDRLNAIMQSGLPNSQVIEEGKAALRALHDAIEAEFSSAN